MDLTHVPVSIPGRDRAYALLAQRPKKAVVFVHGFLGDARKTWSNFQGLIDEFQPTFPDWEKSDLFFYSYPSRGQIKPLAEQFRVFLDEIFPTIDNGSRFFPPRRQPQMYTLPSGRMLTASIENEEPYDRLILVGHSTGALLIREMVLQELRSRSLNQSKVKTGESFILDASLRLFAPAHRGALCAGTVGALFHLPVSEWLLSLMLKSNALFVSLQSGSPAIEDLRRETEQFQDEYHNALTALVAISLFGSNDTIVYIGKYKGDLECPTEPGHSHSSICKPNNSYSKPLEFVPNAATGKSRGF
jgi:pimeloyl-ACP methyl ester carboxylesterase